eukprot:9345243-Lingulodinium_polyedra.AAC.1
MAGTIKPGCRGAGGHSLGTLLRAEKGWQRAREHRAKLAAKRGPPPPVGRAARRRSHRGCSGISEGWRGGARLRGAGRALPSSRRREPSVGRRGLAVQLRPMEYEPGRILQPGGSGCALQEAEAGRGKGPAAPAASVQLP